MISPSFFLWLGTIVILLLCVVRMGGARATVDARLLSACLGDRDQAERLIALEMRRNSTLSRREATSMALARIQRDNH